MGPHWGREMRWFKAAMGDILGLAFSPDGLALAVVIEYQGVYLWNLASTNKPIQLDTSATYRTRDPFFSADGRIVNWLGSEGWMAYDRDSQQTTIPKLDASGRILALAHPPDGSRLVSQHNFPDPTLIGWSAGNEGWVQDWDISTRELSIRALAISPVSELVAVVCQPTSQTPKGARWWETHAMRVDLRSAVSGAVVTSRNYPYYYVNRLLFSPNGDQLVAVHEMTLVVWPTQPLGEPRLLRNDSRKHFTSAAFHPSGRYLIVTSNDATVHVYETTTWERVMRYTWNLGRLRAIVASPDGTLAAAASDDGGIVVWDWDL